LKVAYVDSSCLVAVAFGEEGSEALARKLSSFALLLSSNLLEAELRAALAREGVSAPPEPLLAGIEWVLPDRPLTAELARVLARGYLRGADLWHLACALMLRAELPDLAFLTLDTRQGELAAELDFPGLRAG
jgi:PIN domain nuclease of toxin-antitoxin system